MAVTVIPGACQGCGACLITCPERAIAAAPGGPVILAARCTDCGECEEICPVDAITSSQGQERP
jgi:electron transport complex protein RnfB